MPSDISTSVKTAFRPIQLRNELLRSTEVYRQLHKSFTDIAQSMETVNKAAQSQMALTDTFRSLERVNARFATDVLKPFHDHKKMMDRFAGELGGIGNMHTINTKLLSVIDYGKRLEAISTFQFPSTEFTKVVERISKGLRIELPKIAPVEGLLASQLFSKNVPEVTLETVILEVGKETAEGQLIDAVGIPWFEIYYELQKNPEFLFQFTKHPRRFEEFIAGAYERAGFDKVILTPSSGDRGRDVIAEKSGFGAIRILDQAKAYAKHRPVPANDVRALLGVLSKDPAASKGVVTTTSTFAPGVYKEFAAETPTRLELRAGADLLEFLSLIVQNNVV